jgi:hypothetical protein
MGGVQTLPFIPTATPYGTAAWPIPHVILQEFIEAVEKCLESWFLDILARQLFEAASPRRVSLVIVKYGDLHPNCLSQVV